MIKKLKRRFIWINLSILLTIFFALFAGTYYLMYESGKAQSIKAMEQIAQNGGKISNLPHRDLMIPQSKRDPFPINKNLLRDSFTIILDYSNNIIQMITNVDENTDLSNPEQLVADVLSSNEDTGIISFNDLNLRYLLQTRPNGTQVLVFLDRSTEIATLSQLIFVHF